MTLPDIVDLPRPPVPWQEGDNIPWDDPAFAERMLREHLSQEHDAASRRAETIDGHVAWIHTHVLGERSTRILDLGCGPGLYSSRLARLGHTCVGVDFSPASLAYARQTAEAEGLACEYRQGDLRSTGYGTGYGLAMQIYGETNVFTRADAEIILRKCREALADNGVLLLEVHTFEVVERTGRAPATWYTAREGLFSDRPHLCLTESFWDPDVHACTTGYRIIDGATSEVTVYASSIQGYTEDGYRTLLTDCGFREVEILPSLTGDPAPDSDFIVLLARR